MSGGVLAAAASLLLGLCLFILVMAMLRHGERAYYSAARLHYRRDRSVKARLASLLARQERMYGHISLLLESVQSKIKPEGFLLLSFFLLAAGSAGGGLLFLSFKGSLLSGAMGGLIPYVFLRSLLLHRQMQARMDFLPAVELFYQCYMITGERQIRRALQRVVEEQRLLGPMQPVFEQLYRNLSVRGDDEASLRVFASSLGHMWGDYLVEILRIALVEGNPVSENLRELVGDMRKSRRIAEQERHKLLEIRIANFTPILFLAVFMGINIRYNADNSYRYYLQDAAGRDMLLNALLLIFMSFLMGLWLSRKKM
ncbi:type II secretion system F family protein [Paenibacillus sp. P22]|uniref:type II secretion system F family protein n=1 Tax=Paenibacillus TaxID=44249 RepID=UPI0003F96944|nr:type II secretion system F family protein [Paenibacillus sp. P22]CDN43056.1 Putative uncharacterized protein [Paenibacillus sp. P22]